MNTKEYDILTKYRNISLKTKEEIHLAVKLATKHLDMTASQKNIADTRIDIYEKVDKMFESMLSEIDTLMREEARLKMVRDSTESRQEQNNSIAIVEYSKENID